MLLDNVSLEGIKVPELRRSLSNWMKVSDAIYADATEEELLIMMKIEKEGKNREYIITRLHSRYNKLRITRERKELLG